ncbi:MAG: dnaE1, partial [Alphaproteobacteria bacterium]|nr:dnaE1 [Alphaproteobacteria bacterium]
MASFVHLRVKSAYSLLEGAVRPSELPGLCADAGTPAVAVTDVNNLFGVFEITETLLKAGIQPIVGTLLSVEFAPRSPIQTGSRKKPPHVALLVQNEAGYLNLTRLLSAAYLEVEPGDWPHVKAEKLFAHAEGLILLTGGPGGAVNQLLLDGNAEAAQALLEKMAAAFPGRLYVELQRHNLPEERAVEDGLLDMAYGLALPLVATNDVHFGKANMYEAHDALLCIADGAFVSQDDRRRLT